MAITKINASPSVALVGQKVQLAPVGSYSSALELRWYLYSAPADDGKTITLSNYAALGKKREDARLTPNAGGATFVPTSSGLYEIYVYPTTLYRFRRGYAGAVPAAGQSAELDNETEALPAYAGGTAAVTPVGSSPGVALQFYVAQERKRTFGTPPDTASLTLRFRNNSTIADVPELALDGATLTPGNSSAAKVAVKNPDVLAIMSLIEEDTSIIAHMSLFYSDIATAIARWNTHITLTAGWNTHGAADATNTISSPDASDLASSITLLNELRTKYAAHRVLTAGSVHPSADNDSSSVVTAAAATDFDTALVLWLDLFESMNAHGGNAVRHAAGIPGDTADGAANEQIEGSITEAALPAKTNLLKDYYVAHIGKTANAGPHAALDNNNKVVVQMSTPEGIAGTVNAWADAIERHSRNLKDDGTAAASAYHEPSGDAKTQDIKIPLRASAQDVASIKRTAELCLVAFEAHALSTNADGGDGLHGAKVWGASTYSSFPLSYRYGVRMAKAWGAAVRPVTAPTIPNANIADPTLVLLEGWT
jgi:hypothetical protein